MNRDKEIEKQAIEEMAFDLCRIDTCKHLSQEECNETNCAYCEAEALYNAGYRKQEWISVEERLPDKEGIYLTYTNKDNVDLDIFCIYPSHGTKFWSGERRGKVTHWMPLPEPPKMKGGAE